MKFKLNLRQIRITIFVITIALLVGGVGYWLGENHFSLEFTKPPRITIERTQPADKEDIDFSLFWDVWDRLSASYLDKKVLSPKEMVYGAIQGLVASLGDPYTVFLKPAENKQAKEDLNGAFEGVGIQLGYKDDQLAVVAPLSGMPAEKMGVRAGDLILKIEDKETAGMTLPEAVELIRGPKGTKVRLTFLHEGEKEPYEALITRETIVVPSVEVAFIKLEGKGEVAHLKLTRFGERTNDEWNQVVDQIVSRPSLTGVILDLRNNPGGYLSGSVFITSEFLSSGVVVQQENANGSRESYSVDRTGKITAQPLVVLVNKGSASASEIVAGALQEDKRAKIIGETTFGKGTIQEAQELVGGAGLHVTTARWLLPSGKSIDKIGIIPDNQIKDELTTEEDEQLQGAIKIFTD